MNAVITGGTKGIGQAIVEAFAGQGGRILVCSRSLEDLQVLKQEVENQNPTIEILVQQADLSEKNEVLKFAEFIRSNIERLDVLVNNTGVFKPGEVIGEEDTMLEDLMKTNVYSAYYLTKYLLPLLLRNKRGHIFNICSVASLLAYPDGGSYSISKFALLGFSKVLREELKERGIKVTAVMPGITWSNAWTGANFPVDRLLQPSDVAKVILNAYNLSETAVVEEIVLRPQLGDL